MSDPFDLAAAPPPDSEPPYLATLNDTQRAAVETLEGPVLVLAGAGTGKTRVLTTRLAHILSTGRARPWQVLAVTFTNKAAREMRERVASLLQMPVESWWVGTFHAVCARILRAHAGEVGRKSNFTILDDDDQMRLLKQVLADHPFDDKSWPPRAVLHAIQRWKDRGLVPARIPDEEAVRVASGLGREIYADYQERLGVLNAVDFGDLLLLCLTLFQEHADILARYQQQFRYILVDEYQDTNVAQYLWLRLLAQAHRNICCVGDDDQSIYSWRGAEVGNILRFETDFPGAAVIRLECNYRSTRHILGAASGLIACNQGRLGKTLWTGTEGGEKVRVRGVWDGEAEARLVVDDVLALRAAGQKLDGVAVLVRAGFQTREFEERLVLVGIPYRVIGGPRFYERQEIRDAMAYLRVVAQPDDDLAFERIVNVPKRGIGPAALQTVHKLSRAAGISLGQAVRRLTETDELKPKPRQALAGLLDDFDRWRILMETQRPERLAAMVLEESGYIAHWREKMDLDAQGRLENLKELTAAISEFESLPAFLEHVSLVMDNDAGADEDKISLMTLHGAKGLEFDTVFLPGWEEELFPHQRALQEGGQAALEEERRLAYVGLTRARRRATVIFAASRQVFGQWKSVAPSRFVAELPDAHVVRSSDVGAYAGTRWRTRPEGHPDDDPGDEPAPPSHTFAVDSRVFHVKFGYGKVLSVDGEKLEVSFEKAGTKRVMASFVMVA